MKFIKNHIIKIIDKDTYYNIMCQQLGNNIENMSFNQIHEKWLSCFAYILKSFHADFSYKSIISLFYYFDMDNWKKIHKNNWEIMHRENSKYNNYTKEQLVDIFAEKCCYISDIYTYDRLLRTHWFFREAFSEEIYMLIQQYFINDVYKRPN